MIIKLNGVGGQSSAIAQELAKDWIDEQGKTHRGIYDADNEYSVRWAEPYPQCIKGCLKLLEPKKYRNAMFEAAKLLVPQGAIKFAPGCPKYDILVMDDGTEQKLNKAEQASLIQMDLMKEEIAAMVRIKPATGGNITYQLPPEKRGKMHDDRNYVFVMCCLEIRNLREDEEYGNGTALDYSNFNSGIGSGTSQVHINDDPWLKGFSKGTGTNKVRSPFQGNSPFRN